MGVENKKIVAVELKRILSPLFSLAAGDIDSSGEIAARALAALAGDGYISEFLGGDFEKLCELLRGLSSAGDRKEKRKILKDLYVEWSPKLQRIVEDIERGRKRCFDLSQDLSRIRGIGPSYKRRLNSRGIRTVRDLLYIFPLRYEDRRRLVRIDDLSEGDAVTTIGRVGRVHSSFYTRSKKRTFVIELEGDKGGILKLKWFNYREGYFKDKVRKDAVIIATGVVKEWKGSLEMHHPEFEVLSVSEAPLSYGGIVPVYPEIAGLKRKLVRRILRSAVDILPFRGVQLPQDVLPSDFIWKDEISALRTIHSPSSEEVGEGVDVSVRSLKYWEFVLYLSALSIYKSDFRAHRGISHGGSGGLGSKMEERLPFKLTGAQKRAIAEIEEDMRSDKPMLRLLQGDVGSGKTVVAAWAAAFAFEGGYKTAFMAPTSILAEQHAATLRAFLTPVDIPVFLLTSDVKGEERREILSVLKGEDPCVVVGTHALLSRGVEFKKLGLCVIDEQHRFGVLQRASLFSKGEGPDCLVMSATPIPRSLLLTAFGDTDVSRLDEMPLGRKPVETVVVQRSDIRSVFKEMKKRIDRGERVFFVSPLIDTSEDLKISGVIEWYDFLCKKVFSGRDIGLLHGGMGRTDKERVLRAFKSGARPVLVATPVIEVGIDVPEATLLVVVHPERFGLAQLHQLRGRVGRGSAGGKCILIAGEGCGEEAMERLRAFSRISDGFVLAEVDLRMRGPGVPAGVRQSGGGGFILADPVSDAELFIEVAERLRPVLSNDPKLEKYPDIREEALRYAGERMDLALLG